MAKRRTVNGYEFSASARTRRDLARVASQLRGGRVVIVTGDGAEVSVPKVLGELVRRSASELAAGRDLALLTADEMLSPAEAAEVLGLSRQFVVRLLDDGVIPSERLPGSTHRRVTLRDVLDFQQRRRQRRAGVNELVENARASGVEY